MTIIPLGTHCGNKIYYTRYGNLRQHKRIVFIWIIQIKQLVLNLRFIDFTMAIKYINLVLKLNFIVIK